MENISIRPMTAGDIPALVAILTGPNGSSWSKASFERELELSFSLSVVAEVGGHVAGFGVLWIVVDCAQLVEIAVSTVFRGLGLGKLVLEQLIRLARDRGCTRMELEYRKGNDPAKRLYESVGFKTVAIRKNFYDGNPNPSGLRIERDAVLMACNIA